MIKTKVAFLEGRLFSS